MVYIDLVVEPPYEARVDEVLYPPPVVKLTYVSGESLWAYVTLLTDDGHIVQEYVSGTLVDSAQLLPDFNISNYPRPYQNDSYVAFPNLEITSAGNYRIRITVMCNSSAGTSPIEEVETRRITVQNREPQQFAMGKSECLYYIS